jgi:hypothetical protein
MATKVKGTVKHSDLEGGYWTIEDEEGNAYKLEGAAKDLLKDGVRAEVEGQLEEAIGIGFGTPVLTVKRHKIL